MKKMAALVIELSKTSKVKRRFSALGLSPQEWASTKVLWFSSKLYSLAKMIQVLITINLGIVKVSSENWVIENNLLNLINESHACPFKS